MNRAKIDVGKSTRHERPLRDGRVVRGFPDIQWTLEEMVAEGDKVAARFIMRGTHQGTFFGVPPTGKTISVQAMMECLTNIHRHSESKTALIHVSRETDKIYVEVQDHGKGMSQERFAEVQSQGTGVGIRGMRERVRQVHGELTIESNALGTKIFATFPANTPSAKRQGEIR